MGKKGERVDTGLRGWGMGREKGKGKEIEKEIEKRKEWARIELDGSYG